MLSIHCHDDLGMAVANSLSAVLAGARQVHCTINGIGERAGNASLEELVMALKTRQDAFKKITTNINTKEILRTSRLVSALTGFVVSPNKAIVGRNAFAHESGIHQDAVIKERTTYEIMNPKDVGVDKSQIILGKHSGSHALSKRLEKLGFKFSKEKIAVIFRQFKQLADKKKEVFDDDLIALAEEETKPKTKAYELVSIKVTTGTNIIPQAQVKIRHKNKIYESSSSGDGPVDACYRAVDTVTKIKVKLTNYKIEAITIGKDAQGLVRVEILSRNRQFSGRGSSTDILEASVKAYLDALNKIG